MSVDAITIALGSLAVSTVSLGVSAANAWLTLWRRGTVRMAQPPTVYFGPDGARELHPKIFVRCFLYSTSIRSRCVESMFARLHRGDSSQTFPVWVCGGAGDDLSRGAGLAVGADGVALHHHFLLPRDGTTYQFLSGTYRVELFAVVVGRKRPLKLQELELQVTEAQAAQLGGNIRSGLYFDWSPETRRFHGHIDNARPPDPSPLFFVTTEPAKADGKAATTLEAGSKPLQLNEKRVSADEISQFMAQHYDGDTSANSPLVQHIMTTDLPERGGVSGFKAYYLGLDIARRNWFERFGVKCRE